MGVWENEVIMGIKESEIVDNMEMEQPQVAQNAYYQPVIQNSEKADLFDKINPQDVVEVLRNRLMGYEYDNNRQAWYKPVWAKGLSEMGATEITTLILSCANKNVAISKLTDGEVRDMTKSAHKDAMILCIRNFKEYGISGADQIYLIKQIVKNVVFTSLKQPENAGIRELLKGTTSENRMITESGDKKGIIGSIFRR